MVNFLYEIMVLKCKKNVKCSYAISFSDSLSHPVPLPFRKKMKEHLRESILLASYSTVEQDIFLFNSLLTLYSVRAASELIGVPLQIFTSILKYFTK